MRVLLRTSLDDETTVNSQSWWQNGFGTVVDFDYCAVCRNYSLSRMFVVGGFFPPLIIGPFQQKIQLCIKVGL